MKVQIEDERKFLALVAPVSALSNGKEIVQGYLCDDPATRIRIIDGKKGFLTIKIKEAAGKNYELEEELELDAAQKLLNSHKYNKILKTIYFLGRLEVHVFYHKLKGLVLLEFEKRFPDETVEIPLGFEVREVTGDERFDNHNLAKLDSLPKEWKCKDASREKIYELDRGLEVIKFQIQEKKRKISRPLIIGIAGGSGSGKTAKVAKKIQEMFPDCSKILSMDDYFRGIAFMRSIGSNNFDEPQVVELDLLAEHLRALKQNLAIKKPVYSFKTGERESYEEFCPSDIIILDGLFALYDGIVNEVDLRVFIEIAVHGSLIRRILRDVGRTGQKEEDIFKQYAETVYPAYKTHIEPTKSCADIVIANQYSPEIETQYCKNREIQIKAPLSKRISPKTMRSRGFKKISRVLQEDTYYAAPGWNLSRCDELMRIRKQGDKYYLTYKGPLRNGSLRIKPLIEFEVEPSLKNALRTLGYRVALVAVKQREIYAKQDVEAAIDKIKGIGYFLEIRMNNSAGEPQILELFRKLGIGQDIITKKSYFEILSGITRVN